MKKCPIDSRWHPHVHTSDEIADFMKNSQLKLDIAFGTLKEIVSLEGTTFQIIQKAHNALMEIENIE